MCTWPAQGIVGDDHPLFFGRPGSLAPRYSNFILQNADAMVAFGTRLDLASTGYDYNDFGRVARKVVIDIDPNELEKLKDSIELGFEVDAGRMINAMLEVLEREAEQVWVDVAGWMSQCATWRNRYPLLKIENRKPDERISTYEFADALSELLTPEDVIAPGCSGLALEIFLLSLRLKTGQRVICNYALGAMGYGPPTALGASIGSGGRRTICVDGDGGLQLNVQELETIRRLDLPIKLFVLENDGYASIRASQSRWFGHVFAADPPSGLTLPRLELLAAAYGLPYRKIRTDIPLLPQIRDVLEVRGPVVCEVPTPLDEKREPSQTSEALADGTMRSRAIEDLAPLLDRGELAANILPIFE
jgi:acetolactate synthase-1/2/3 large subunit